MEILKETRNWIQSFQNLDEKLLCPTRREYSESENHIIESCKQLKIKQTFFETENILQTEKFQIVGYHTLPEKETDICLIYCHTRNSNLEESEFLLNYTHEHAMALCSFDFRAHGRSGNKYSSLGFWETLDIETVLEYLALKTPFKKFILWGRSMGSVACLNYSSKHHRKTLKNRFKIALKHTNSVVYVVLDSPYFSIISCGLNLVRNFAPNLPEFVTNSCLMYVDADIQKKIGVSLEEMNIGFQSYHLRENPYRFIFSLNDEIISLSEQNKIYERVQFWDKKIYKVPGKHNAKREESVLIDIFNSMHVFNQSSVLKEAKISHGENK